MVDLGKFRGKLEDHVIDQLNETLLKYQMTDPLEVSHFLAQAAYESQGFTRTAENMNYSAVRLLQVFPKYFDGSNAEEYAHNPQAIASRVYASRLGNGPEETTEGWRYVGRGYLRLRGRDNYVAFDATVNDDLVARPELVSTKYPMLSAGWFWKSKGLSGLATQGATPGVVQAVTHALNGNNNSLNDRVKRFDYIYGLMA